MSSPQQPPAGRPAPQMPPHMHPGQQQPQLPRPGQPQPWTPPPGAGIGPRPVLPPGHQPPPRGMPPYQPGWYAYRPLASQPPKPPSAMRKLVILVVLAACTLAFVGSMVTPLFYPAGQPWSGGFFLWQWTPHLLGGETEFVTGLFVFYFISTMTCAIGAMLAAAGVMGRLLTVVWGLALGIDALISLFMLLILAGVAADETIAAGPATWLNMLGIVLACIALATPTHRMAWVRDSTF